MKKQVLFIHGGGEGAYEADAKLALSLQAALGAAYEVGYPEMPDPGFEFWKARISKEYAALNGDVIFVGHSFGASVLLKYLTEADVAAAGIFLVATPYWGTEDWEVDEYTLLENFASQLSAPVFLYHSRDDEIVPFEHLALYAEQLPDAIIREFEGRDHQFNDDLSAVAWDILHLQEVGSRRLLKSFSMTRMRRDASQG